MPHVEIALVNGCKYLISADLTPADIVLKRACFAAMGDGVGIGEAAGDTRGDRFESRVPSSKSGLIC